MIRTNPCSIFNKTTNGNEYWFLHKNKNIIIIRVFITYRKKLDSLSHDLQKKRKKKNSGHWPFNTCLFDEWWRMSESEATTSCKGPHTSQTQVKGASTESWRLIRHSQRKQKEKIWPILGFKRKNRGRRTVVKDFRVGVHGFSWMRATSRLVFGLLSLKRKVISKG